MRFTDNIDRSYFDICSEQYRYANMLCIADCNDYGMDSNDDTGFCTSKCEDNEFEYVDSKI